MKIQATKEDLARIGQMEANSQLDKWMRWKDTLNFTVGDILIKEVDRSYRTEPKWDVEKASSTSLTPAKYVYIYKDNYGVGYIKKLTVDGKNTVGYPQSMYDMDLDRVRFKVDADYQDAVLLGKDDEYDPARNHSEEKKLRQEIREYNKKQVLNVANVEALEKWFRSNKGKCVWLSYDRTGDNFSEHEIGNIIDKQNYEGSPYKVVELKNMGDIAQKIQKGNFSQERIDQLQGSGVIFVNRPKSIKDYK